MTAIAQLAGGLINSGAAGSAASAQSAADQKAIAGQQAQYQTTSNNLTPYITTGTNNLSAYGAQPANTQSALNTSFNNAQNAVNNIGTSSLAQLQALPGYQQALSQGLNSTQASAASRGLGVSGASMKGAANFATGLAGQQYQNLYNQQLGIAQAQQNQNTAQINNQNAYYNQLAGTVGTGLTAANNLGYYGQQSQNEISSAYNNQGLAQAQGILGSASALTSGLTQGVGSLVGGNFLGGSGSGASQIFNGLSGLFSGGGGGSVGQNGGNYGMAASSVDQGGGVSYPMTGGSA